MKLNFKIERWHVILGMLTILTALIFLATWLFADRTQIFNDYIVENSLYGYKYGWIHMAINIIWVVVFIIWCALFFMEAAREDCSPLKKLYDGNGKCDDAKEALKTFSTRFFYHWYNQKGNNTLEGFDKWWNEVGENLAKEIGLI